MNADNEFVSRACPAYETALEDYLDGSLDNVASRKLTEHLKVCAGCSQALDEAAAASQWVRHAEPVADPGPAFARIVMARIRAEEEARGRAGFWEPFVSLAWKFATTAALALVVMLAYASRGTNSATGANVATVAAQSEMQQMLMPAQSTVPATRSDVIMMVTESDNAER
jgi:predicted anti-sigma-YlaC factor YlaD